MAGIFEKIKAHLTEDKLKTVYRFVSEREKRAIEACDISGIGSTWEQDSRRNTHKYKEGVRYVHFVANKHDTQDVYRELKRSKCYLCTYRIPNSILKKYAGKGFYPPHGYDNSYTEIKEYAIPSEQYNPEWLQKITLVNPALQEEMADLYK